MTAVSYSHEFELSVAEQSASSDVITVNLRFGYNRFHEGWTFMFMEREGEVSSLRAILELSYSLSVVEMRSEIDKWLLSLIFVDKVREKLIEGTMWYVEYLIEVRERKFGPRHYEELIKTGDFNWLGDMPTDQPQREGIVVETFTKGTWSFRGFRVQVGDQTYLWPGARYDMKQNLWWGNLEGEVIFWQASPPPPLESLINTSYDG